MMGLGKFKSTFLNLLNFKIIFLNCKQKVIQVNIVKLSVTSFVYILIKCFNNNSFAMWLFLLALLVLLLLIRLIYLVISTFRNKRNNVSLQEAKTLIVLGSGG